MASDPVICNACSVAADHGLPHLDCPGDTWCDCQHNPVVRAAPNASDDNPFEEA